VLILHERTILVDARPVKLYSLDGRLWVSEPRDVTEFKQRRARVKASLQRKFALHAMPNHIARGIVDFWSA